MNYILKQTCTANIADIQIKELAKHFKLDDIIIKLLVSRNISTIDDIERFLHPKAENLYDPYLLKGMKVATERIQNAISNNEKVVIYGDYDVDGISSSAILYLYLKSQGLQPIVHIPNRNEDGYGLNVNSIKRIVEKYNPDLILTCDCGISAIEEVEYLNSINLDIIITDHHEAGSVLPNCTIVNPKQADCTYPDKYLCGAGVAFKVVQALSIDNEYMEYIDLACIATIADIVPLQNENRLIVQLGLDKIKSIDCNPCVKILVDRYTSQAFITASDIAYKITPVLNAAGRIGDAFRAHSILVSTDDSYIKKTLREIEDDNLKRKELCEKLYNEAIDQLKNEDIINNRAIILTNENWNKGVTGIAAAKIANEFNRPTFILAETNDDCVLKGTSRSVNGINLFELLSQASDLLVEFGGHSGAAGFSIKKANINIFKDRINNILSTYDCSQFMSVINYDIEIDEKDITKKLYENLQLLEPTGCQNPKPLLKTKVTTVKYSSCKNIAHTCIVLNNINMYAYNFFTKNQYLNGDNTKEIVFEITEGFNKYVSGNVKAVVPNYLYINDDFAKAIYLHNTDTSSLDAKYKPYMISDLKSLMPKNIYGTLFICGCGDTYNDFISNYSQENIPLNGFIYMPNNNNYNAIIASPLFTELKQISNYNKIVFLDAVENLSIVQYLNLNTTAEIYIPIDKSMDNFYADLNMSREIFSHYYNLLYVNKDLGFDNINKYLQIFYSKYSDINLSQLVICKTVFCELGIMIQEDNELKIVSNVKKALTDSKTYTKIIDRGLINNA